MPKGYTRRIKEKKAEARRRSYSGRGGGGVGARPLRISSSGEIIEASTKPLFDKTKYISYNATVSDQIFSIKETLSADTTNEVMPTQVMVKNVGKGPVMVMAGYETYTDSTSDGAIEFLHALLAPNEVFIPPTRGIIVSGVASTPLLLNGTPVTNTAPNSNMYVDSGANVDTATSGDIASDATEETLYLEPYTSAANCTANLFRIGDLIRLENEICEVTDIGTKAGLSTNTLTIKRGLYGSTAATHADAVAVRLPFFNTFNDFDRGGIHATSITDIDGKFHCYNFYGLGRTQTEVQGIVPGSIALKFYTEGGYQELGLSGVTPSTNTGLTASTAYEFDIQVDGGTNYDNLSFTTSANVNFGGSDGVIQKIQDALDVQYYTAGNLFEKKVRVHIVDGDVRFSSGSNLSTTAIALTAGSTGTAEFFGTGRIPAVGSLQAPVASSLPPDIIWDPVTYTEETNDSAFCYDDGNGNLQGVARGTINYETGEIEIRNAPPEGAFVLNVLHTSVFGGALNEATADRINSLTSIHANNVSQSTQAMINIKAY